MNKLISVIIPVKNGEKYLWESIESVQNQDMELEIIVVNDASDDSSPEIASEMGCVVLNHETCRGPVVAKNTGLVVAKGEYILFEDADDVMREGALRAMYEELESHPEISAVMTKVKDFISPDLTEEQARGCVPKPEAYYGVLSGAAMIRREAFDIIGMFDENITAGEVISFKTKFEEKGLILGKLDIISKDRRIHNDNFGRTNKKKEYQDYASLIRARMKR